MTINLCNGIPIFIRILGARIFGPAVTAGALLVGACACGDASIEEEKIGSVQLDIPPREQWRNGHGYCGETSLQSIALHYGAWVSQQVVRDAAGGELLLAVNETKALDALHFDYENWDYEKTSAPQFQQFATWLKGQMVQGHPVIFAAYLSESSDLEYDHIMPAVGIDFRRASGYDAQDTLSFNTNFGGRVRRTFGASWGTRQSCINDSNAGGCIPQGVDYGIAVLGITDRKRATLPVRLVMARNAEPNVSLGESAETMQTTVTVSGLTKGRSYALLRYDKAKNVPTDAMAAGFLASKYDKRVDFTATGNTWAESDTFDSDGVAYYRCVPR
ncbi:C39 family peptidase [Pendulispora brunnea]|uniref:C39 family peptidase n=1 Tax=Pendulispora brunnea TaxID=2905690 RepID=A0ABZ2KMQ8_9BACT